MSNKRKQLKQEDGLRNSMFLARLSGVVAYNIKLGKITDKDFIQDYQELIEYYEFNTVPSYRTKGATNER